MAEDVPSSQSITGDNNVQVMGDSNVVTVFRRSRRQQERNRVLFLAQLRFQYNELWNQSLQGAALLTLGLTLKPDAVLHHTKLQLRAPNLPEHPLPEGTSIVKVYDDAGQELLILGEPGAGKSLLLLDLARQLVENAERDATQLLPVIVPLSTWAVKRQPLTEWLAAQLSLIYDVPSKLSRTWVQADQILPLLDGLDEMPWEARMACIGAITSYREKRSNLIPLVVCSRSSEYEKIPEGKRLGLNNAVVIRPLTWQQVETYLDRAGQSLAAARVILHTNPTLQELTTTPLMLNVLALTYTDAEAKDLPQQGTADEQQRLIFTSYVKRTVERKGKHKGEAALYPLERTQVWLGWLARQMQEHNQMIFYLEQLQPDWLPKKRRAFYQWSVRLLVGLAIGLVGGLLVGLVVGLVGGLLFGLVGGLAVGLAVGPVKIEPVEAFTWSWGKALFGLVVGLVGGLLGGLAVGLLVGQPDDQLFGLGSGLVVGLLGGLLGGLSTRQLTERLTLSPNEGIRRSVKYGLGSGLVFGLLGGLLGGLCSGLAVGPYYGLLGGLLVGLLGGLGAAMQHYILCFWLACTHTFPWKAQSFLDDATTRILLLRVGGGYKFYHPLLLDYFADLDAHPSPSSTSEPSTPSSTPQLVNTNTRRNMLHSTL